VLASIVGFALLLAVVLALVLGLGVGVGVIVHWWLPQIDLGLSTLIGLMAVIAALHVIGRILSAINEYRDEADFNEWLEEPEEPTAMTTSPLATNRPRRHRKRNLDAG
jgi:hypothetical protein